LPNENMRSLTICAILQRLIGQRLMPSV
jgi:hypothetical protein